MDVEITCYGEVARAVGTKTLTLTVAEDATLEDLLAELESEVPGFDRTALSGGLVALVDGTHADADDNLTDGCAVALSQSPMRE